MLYLRLLGTEEITREKQRINLPSKGYLLLAYLLLEGRTARKDLANLFWLGSSDALNNLSKLTKAVNDALCQKVLVSQAQWLEVVGIQSDIGIWNSISGLQKWEMYRQELMFGFRLPEWSEGRGVELEEWLEQKRRDFAAQHINNSYELALNHLNRGEWKMALPYVERLAINDTDPQDRALSWWFLIMGAFGQQEQARNVFRQWQFRHVRQPIALSQKTRGACEAAVRGDSGYCIEALRSEFGHATSLPLVGRTAVLKRMEEAWKRGQAILISGEPGAGKSRLALEFAKQKGSFWRFWGRPSDHFVPYSFHSRSFGWMFSNHPDLRVPDWVRREMARIIPELGEPPAPLNTPEERLRFVEAQTETFRLACKQFGFATMLIEDAQFADEASAQAGVYIHSKLLPYQKDFPRTIFTFRAGGFPPHIQATMREWVAQDIAVWIDLEPLTEAEILECLALLSPSLLDHRQRIMEISGGNPLLMLETARFLLENPSHAVALKHPNLNEIIQARLARVPAESLRVLRLAAILDEHFQLEPACFALGCHSQELQWHILLLESLHLLRDYRIPHDLLLEAILADMSATQQAEFHRLALKALKNAQVPASLLLFHASRASDQNAQALLQQKVNTEARDLLLRDNMTGA